MRGISLIAVFFNEAECAKRVAEEYGRFFSRNCSYPFKLTLVDNGSTDNTRDILDKVSSTLPHSSLIYLDNNRGFGMGVLAGVRAAEGDYVGYVPGDGQVRPEDALKSFELCIEGGWDMVIGRRVKRTEGLFRRSQSRAFNKCIHLLFGINNRDVNATPKVLCRDLWKRLMPLSEGWFLDAELLIKARAIGLRIKEMDIVPRSREGGRSKVNPITIAEILWEMGRFKVRS